MKIKFLVLAIFALNSVFVRANDLCELESEIIQIGKSVSYPNCLKREIVNSFQAGDTKQACDTCKKSFEIVLNSRIQENPTNLRESFFRASFDEYKKNLINNIMNAVKLRSLPNTSSNFKKAISSCRFKPAEEIAKSCSNSPKAAALLRANSALFSDMSNEIANDVAKFLAKDAAFQPERTLLKRGKTACFIPEDEVLFASTTMTEELLSEKFIDALSVLDPKKFKTIMDLFASDEAYDSYGEKGLEDLQSYLNVHPLLSQYLKSPESFISFLKTIPKPANALSLQKALYSSENQDRYDDEIAKNCEQSFKGFTEALCSDGFEKGSISLKPYENLSKLSAGQLSLSDDEFAASDEKVKSNIKFLEYCENKTGQALDLTVTNSKISSLLNRNHQNLNLSQYSTEKFNAEVGSITSKLCEMTDEKCVEGTPTCSMYKKYKKLNDKGSFESKLASSSNSEVNALLRSMIGDTTKIEAPTKAILVASGILPKDDGTIVAQPTIPERQADYFAKVPQPAAKPSAAFAPSSTERKTASQNAARQYEGPDYTQTSFQNLKTPSNVDFKDLIDDSTQDLKDIQDEIRRRLTDFGPSKVNKAQAQKIVKESFAASGKTPTPAQESSFTNRIMDSVTPAVSAAVAADPQPVAVAGIGADTGATGSTTKAWREAQKNEALAGMAGAQAQATARDILDAKAAAAAAAADPAAKPLTNVALSINEDPRVSLSEVLNDKINRNDSETQLLKVLVRNKQPFMLKVKDLNFKVIFDNGQPKILLDSGDKKEAERLRPQLELFFNKLRSNSIYVIR